MLGFFFPSLAQNIFATLHLEDVCTKSDPQLVKVQRIFVTIYCRSSYHIVSVMAIVVIFVSHWCSNDYVVLF